MREQLLAEKEAEIRSLEGLRISEVAPSRRDFAQFVTTQKQGIAIVPRLARRDPVTGGAWPDADFVALARAFDDSEAAALAVATAALHDGSLDDLRAVTDATGLAVLRDDLILHPNQLYQARLYGADAVILPAAHVAAGRLAELAQIARSMHMMAVIEVMGGDDLPLALGLATACIGLACPGADGFADFARACRLAEAIPRARTVLLLSEPPFMESLHALEGLIDAAVVGNILLDAPDPVALVQPGAIGSSGPS